MTAIAGDAGEEGSGSLLLDAPLTARQAIAIAMCVLLNALDGFDVLSMSFAGPGIAAEWGLDNAVLGWVLSMELIGMAAGSILLGQVADRIGRRPMVLVCLAIMAIGMAATTQAGTVTALALTRLATGFGIGGMLSTSNALVSEYANRRARGTAVALMAAGFPLGGIIGGTIIMPMLAGGGWRMIFLFGASVTALSLPLVLALLPESPDFLLAARAPDALARVNRALARLGHAALDCLPAARAKASRVAIARLFEGKMAFVTLALTAAYFLHILAVYFLLKWLPKIVVDMGYPATTGSAALIAVNIGGLIGGLVFSLILLRAQPRLLLIVFLLGSGCGYVVFGLQSGSLDLMRYASVAASFWANGAMVGIYALAAISFPPEIRSGGVGFVIGVGRFGAALGLVIGGALFAMGVSLVLVAALMGLASISAAAIVAALPSTRSCTHKSPAMRGEV